MSQRHRGVGGGGGSALLFRAAVARTAAQMLQPLRILSVAQSCVSLPRDPPACSLCAHEPVCFSRFESVRECELLSSVFRSVLITFPPLRSHSLIANASQTLKHALTLSSLTHFLPSQPQLPLHRTVAPRARLGPRRRLRHPSCCTATRGDGRVCWVVC